MTTLRNKKRLNRHNRIRARIMGTAERPRLAVFRSNKQFYAQLVDDEAGETLIGVTSLNIKNKSSKEKAQDVAKEIAKKAKEKGIEKVVFDRGGFLYTGNIKLFADTAREAGLIF
ncbi:MAG: 50S ribosomal protein L18 [Candidatus Campbellbacteria bacterium]|nr:50S ribosomal protein L18 [Candidatus Campbellbacteria bacterium]